MVVILRAKPEESSAFNCVIGILRYAQDDKVRTVSNSDTVFLKSDGQLATTPILPADNNNRTNVNVIPEVVIGDLVSSIDRRRFPLTTAGMTTKQKGAI